jgi:hypothetical protein
MTWNFKTTNTGNPVIASICLLKFNWFTSWDVHENSLIGSNIGSGMLDSVKESHTLTKKKRSLERMFANKLQSSSLSPYTAYSLLSILSL